MNHGDRENDPELPSRKMRGGDYTDVQKQMILTAHNELGLGYRKIVTNEGASLFQGKSGALSKETPCITQTYFKLD